MTRRATLRGAERTPLDETADVLICGASFAGLAVARELAGSGADVLIVDRYEIGERATSACAAPTPWLHAMGVDRFDRKWEVGLEVGAERVRCRTEGRRRLDRGVAGRLWGAAPVRARLRSIGLATIVQSARAIRREVVQRAKEHAAAQHNAEDERRTCTSLTNRTHERAGYFPAKGDARGHVITSRRCLREGRRPCGLRRPSGWSQSS